METKLHMPDTPRYFVHRMRLIEKMDHILQGKLMIVSAPPGFGKSTLVRDWISQRQITAGWLSLDRGENDLLSFWSYFSVALEKMKPGISQKVHAFLQPSFHSGIESFVALLVNELLDVPVSSVLVLDDYHLIDNEEVHRSLSYFIERAPRQLHMILISRLEIPFSLGNFRVKGQLVELGIFDLRFSMQEIKAYWQGYVGTELAKDELHQLQKQTEGWVAGLQLAAVSQKELHHPTKGFSYFTGRHRFVAEYLWEEVFSHLSERLQDFLLKTSILSRLNDSLCSKVTGIEESLLREIEQANLFLIPLDGERYWYRYHHLFAEYLSDRLERSCKDIIPSLHLKASEWYEQNNDMEAAIDHSLTAEEYRRAVQLIEENASSFLKRRDISALNHWLKQLPSQYVQQPLMLTIQAWTQSLLGDNTATLATIRQLEEILEAEKDVHDPSLIMKCKMESNIIKSFIWLSQSDFPKSYQFLERQLDPECEDKIIFIADGEIESLFFYSGIEFNEGSASLLRGACGFYGRVKQARIYHELNDKFVEKFQLQQNFAVGNHYAIQAEVHYERNELKQAEAIGKKSLDVGIQTENLGVVVTASIVLSRIHWVHGRKEEAFDQIDQSMSIVRHLAGGHSHWLEIFQAFLVRYAVLLKDHESVERWLEKHHLHTRREVVTVYQDFENHTLLRVWLSQGKFQEALDLAQRMFIVQQQAGRIGSMMETVLLQTAAHYRLEDIPAAMERLQYALELGKREGYLRSFLDEQTLLQDILQRYSKAGPKASVYEKYVNKLLGLMGTSQTKSGDSVQTTASLTRLTPRELEILQLLAQGYTNSQMAEKLVLSVGTIKLHLNRIYGKLHVNNRIQAIQRAKELHMLA